MGCASAPVAALSNTTHGIAFSNIWNRPFILRSDRNRLAARLPQISLFFSIVAEWRRHAFRSVARSTVGTELSEIGRGRIGASKASVWYLRWRAPRSQTR